MKIIQTQIKGCNGPCTYRADQDGIEAALMEIRVFLEEDEEGSVTVTFGEMTEEEYGKLPEFDGY